MITITLFTKSSFMDVERKIRGYLEKSKQKIPYQLIIIDIETDPALLTAYDARVPYLQVGPYHLSWPFSQQDLSVSLQAAHDRKMNLEQTKDPNYIVQQKRGSLFSRADRFTLWFSDHYMAVFNILVALYVGLAFFAPVLMRLGSRGPARVIYSIYSPLCHQLTYRSWFLFGEQWFYPRELAGLDGFQTYTQATGYAEQDVLQAKRFIGNETLGYKVALCQRDIAIYSGILLFGILYSITRHRIKSGPWYIWLLLGIAPLGFDGVSQLPSLLTYLPDWLPLRESTPLLRTITGLLFGITTAWYGYPLVEESVQDSRRLLLQKRAILKQTAEVEQIAD
ncbi:MAG: DUF2085 domain-containing protein [Anaerolineaceae bacterium]|nr:DUF2085 domain-containing protein [Anaerolineaceae bacterium]MBN2676735.1 DUF2085 domain-containing protein [Anaerolineaceae bacterium]